MMQEETALILQYALQSEENLGVAIKVGLAFQDLQRRIIQDFLDAARAALQDTLWTCPQF